MVMIKDNHIAAAGGIAAAVQGAEVRGRACSLLPACSQPRLLQEPLLQPSGNPPAGLYAGQRDPAAAGGRNKDPG
jgi:hypothetical protein